MPAGGDRTRAALVPRARRSAGAALVSPARAVLVVVAALAAAATALTLQLAEVF